MKYLIIKYEKLSAKMVDAIMKWINSSVIPANPDVCRKAVHNLLLLHTMDEAIVVHLLNSIERKHHTISC